MSPEVRQQPESMPSPFFSFSTAIPTPLLLRIDRYRIKPGTDVAVHHLQKRIAIALARHSGAHPCLAIESLSGPPEVWRVSGFQSAAEQRRAIQGKAADLECGQELNRIDSQLRVLVGEPTTLSAAYCVGPGRRQAWAMGRGHYLVVTRLTIRDNRRGAVYQASDGYFYQFASARTRKSADQRAALAGSAATVFTVRPTWSLPASAWIRTDPAFWSSSPLVKISN